MNIVEWITVNEAADKPEHGLGGMGGFFQDGMRWPEYLACFKPEAHPDLEELRASILTHRIRCTGDQRQNAGGLVVPLWSDGTVDTYSWRAWGDLMAAVWSTADSRDYSYMDFYM